jgi:hypothetical protein
VYALSAQRIEVSRQGRNKGFTFTCGHFGNFTVVQHHATDELNIVMHHVPNYLGARGLPAVFIDGFVAFDTHKILRSGQVAV